MSLESYHQDLLNSVRTEASVGSQISHEAFFINVAEKLSVAEEVDNLQYGYYEGTGLRGRKLRLDGYDFGDEENQVVVAVTHYVDTNELQTITDTEVKKLFGQVQAFIENCFEEQFLSELEESSPGYQFASEFNRKIKSIHKVRIYLLTNAVLSQRTKGFETTEHDGIVFEYHPWDLERFQRVEFSALGREEIEIDFREEHGLVIPVLKAPISAAKVATYLAVVPGRVLEQIYAKHGSRILESNVRAFLSNRGNVNKGIRGTLEQQPALFLSYNNGITATASEVKIEKTAEGLALVGVTDLQIVNGGQTTASLYYAKKDNKNLDLSNVFVQMKLIRVDDSVEADLVPKISRFANSQNAVSAADFFSNHPYHQRMEEKSRRILAPAQAGTPFQTKWFYERARGQHATERSKLTGSAQQKKFDAEYPKKQLITKTDAAKYLVTWEQQPHTVSQGVQKNFTQFAKEIDSKWEVNETQFNDLYFKQLIAKALIFERLRERVFKSEWYKSATGYLANIVTYTVSAFSHEISQGYKGNTLDLEKIWQHQDVGSDLLGILEEGAKEVRLLLTNTNQNVTERAKSAKFWDLVKLERVFSTVDLSEYLVSEDAQLAKKKEATSDQKLLNGIEAIMFVHEKGQLYWSRLRSFARQQGMLSDKDAGIISVATGERGNTIPTERQAQYLVRLAKNMEGMGFVGN